MTPNVHLWKFWTWEILLVLVFLGITVGGLLLAPELVAAEFVAVLRERRVEILLLAMLLVMVLTVVAYRLATGALIGVVKWLVLLIGSGLAVACITLAPVFALMRVLKPEYVDFTSPFAALFVLWCCYGVIFLIRWQTRLFYRLVDQLR